MSALFDVLILGAKGFVGSAMMREAGRRGLRALGVDLDNYEASRGASCDLLLNANGNSKKFLSDEDPNLDFDLSVRSVARSLRDFRFLRYTHLSTIDVYPEKSDPALNTERAPIDPARLSRYGFHKHLAEQLVRVETPAWLIVRMGGFVGPGLRKNAIYDLLKGQPLRVHPDSRYQFMRSDDMARIVFDLAAAGAGHEILNVAGDGLVSPREVAATIPHASLEGAPMDKPPERYEVNIEAIRSRTAVPRTADAVARFVRDVLDGKEHLA